MKRESSFMKRLNLIWSFSFVFTRPTAPRVFSDNRLACNQKWILLSTIFHRRFYPFCWRFVRLCFLAYCFLYVLRREGRKWPWKSQRSKTNENKSSRIDDLPPWFSSFLFSRWIHFGPYLFKKKLETRRIDVQTKSYRTSRMPIRVFCAVLVELWSKWRRETRRNLQTRENQNRSIREETFVRSN